jgi:putative NADH-flavin reductase
MEMRTLKLTHAQTQSKIIFAITVMAMTGAAGLALTHHAVKRNKAATAITPAVPQVVVTEKRMSVNEKLVYDVDKQEVARVEIVGKR